MWLAVLLHYRQNWWTRFSGKPIPTPAESRPTTKSLGLCNVVSYKSVDETVESSTTMMFPVHLLRR